MIRIYVANLAKYVEGELKGIWIDLPCDDLEEQIQEMLDGNEEYAIHDYDTDLEGLTIAEYDNVHELNELAEHLEDYDDALLAIIESTGYDWKYCVEVYNNGDYSFYPGCNTLEDLAYELVEEGCFGNVDDSIRCYIDYEAIGRDLGFDGYTETNKGVIRVR